MNVSQLFFFSAYAAAFCLSFVGHVVPAVNPVLFIACLLLFAVLAFRRLKYGLYLLFADLFADSFGYVFSWSGVSLRVALTGIFFLIVLIRSMTILSRPTPDKGVDRRLIVLREIAGRDRLVWVVYVLFMFWLGISFIHGWIRNGYSNAFQDANGLLFLLLLPVIAAIPALDGDEMRRAPADGISIDTIFTILKAALFWQFVYVSAVEFMFSRWGVVPVVYTFIRDNRLGEITPAFGNFYRVFLQSEVFAVTGVFMAIIAILTSTNSLAGERDQHVLPSRRGDASGIVSHFGLLFISSAVLLISLSRSFWVGCVMAGLVLLMYSLRALSFKEWFARWLLVLAAMIASVVFVMMISNTGIGTTRVIQGRADMTEPAASSRQAQFGPLSSAIRKSPIIGYGFGKELTYRSSDPRRIQQSGGSGLVRTWAFELGWHDFALKTGIIGVLLHLSFIFFIMKRLYQTYQEYHDTRGAIMFLSILALVIIHAVTPYLNHPLGIGTLMLAVIGIMNHESGITTQKNAK